MSSLIQPLTLSGVGQYATDFQSVLNRAVQIAEIPLQILTNQQTNIQQQESAASSLNSAVARLATDVGTLATLGGNKALVASSTDSSIVTATATGATANTSYTISNVTSVARAAAESSLTSYTDATTATVSASGTLRLTVGTNHYDQTFDSSTNNLTGVENWINGLGAGVTAQILTASDGDYLSISANNPGATTLTLADDPTGANTQLLTSQNQGANTIFQLNGININTPSTNINDLVPGMTFTINGTTSANQTATVSLNSNSSQLSSALQSLVTDYNAVATQVNAQTGSSAGALSGNSIIWQIRGAMMNLVNYYGGSGSIKSLSDLGISLDQSGTMSFDSTKLNSLSNSQLNDAFSFLGSATSGLGALQSQFTAISDPVSGTIHAQVTAYAATNTRLTSQISTLTGQINTMQSNLQQQLAAADSAITQLQSEQSLLTSSIQSLNYSTYGQQILSNQGL